MDFEELRKLVKQGEGQHTEFKLKATHPEKIVRGMVALANSEGGWLFLGVDDTKIIKGVKFPLDDEFVMIKAIGEYASPPLRYKLDKIPIEENPDREVLAFYIPKASELHYFKENPTDRKGKAYIRIGDKSFKASPEMWEILKYRIKNKAINIRYGDKERTLLQYLEQNKHITVDEFAKIAQIPRLRASRTLVTLVVANVLKIHPQENGQDFFEYNEQKI
jgi:predicted HTH transcriptional regulator